MLQFENIEAKRSSARESLWNQLADWFGMYFCLATPILLSHFILLSLKTSIVFQEEFICSVFAFFDTRQGQAWCLAVLWTVSLPVCKWNPLGVLVDVMWEIEDSSRTIAQPRRVCSPDVPPVSRDCKSGALITSLLVWFLPPVLWQNPETLVLSVAVLKGGSATHNQTFLCHSNW